MCDSLGPAHRTAHARTDAETLWLSAALAYRTETEYDVLSVEIRGIRDSRSRQGAEAFP